MFLAPFLSNKGIEWAVPLKSTDSMGNDAYNQKLTEVRANAIKRWLTENGNLGNVAITAVGFGERQPIAPNTTPDGKDDPHGRAKNRRVSIVVEGQT